MKKFLNSNKYIIISIFILTVLFVISLSNFLVSFNNNKKDAEKEYNNCILEENNNCDEVKEILTQYEIPPAPLLYTYIISNGDYYIEALTIFSIFFVVIPAIYDFYISVRSKYFFNELQRISYKKNIKRYYVKSLRALIVLPTFLVITFLITCIVANFKFQYQSGSVEYGGIFWTSRSYARTDWISYFTVMFLVLFSYSFFYINLAYVSFYRVKTFFTNLVLNFLVYIFSQIVVVYMIQYFLSNVIKIKNNDLILSLEEPLRMTFGMDISNYYYVLLSSILYSIISFVIFKIFYNNKERFVKLND